MSQFFQQFRRDREQIATGQLDDFAGVAEAGPHDFGFVAELFVVAVNVRDRFHAGIFGGRNRIDPSDFLYQSKMRPTNGEISVTPASAQATACGKLNSSVRLQWMPSFCSFSAALMPSQVEAILIRIRSRLMPASSYSLISRGLGHRGFAVERQPGIDFGRNTAGHDLENLLAEIDEQPIDQRSEFLLLSAFVVVRRLDRFVDQSLILRHLGRLINQRRIRRRIARRVFGKRFEIAGIGNDDGHRFELFEKTHNYLG